MLLKNAIRQWSFLMTVVMILTLIATLWLSWSNGANDNFKGVATIYGSGAASYHVALTWATMTTLAGSVLSVMLARELLKSFSGSGIVPKELTTSGPFLLAVAVGGAGTIFAATWIGMPTSTTHALTGALLGAGLVAGPFAVIWSGLWGKFLFPLTAARDKAWLGASCFHRDASALVSLR